MTAIACGVCQNVVNVERYTETQISVQWTGDAEAVCAEFARRSADGQRSMTIPTCRALRATIELNIADEVIRVTARREPLTRGGDVA